ncbi:MAG: hypothetical protein EHM17_08955 [Verrucomicrobiaceae bacterium]|nr:MAG: hypothetical protein EHM17_08955 [Verrucomicrobiaceae bacterium]
MIRRARHTGILILMMVAAGLQPLCAQLPPLAREPWLGYFAVYEGSRYQFAVSSNGEMQLAPIISGKPVSSGTVIKLTPTVSEILSSGKSVTKKLIPDSLETPDAATTKLEKAVFRGKVTGGAAFEVTLEQNRGIIFIGGRILDPGEIKNPLRFSISTKIPNLYPNDRVDRKADARQQRKDEKELADKMRSDRLTLKSADDNRFRQNLSDKADPASEPWCGPGIAELELDSEAYKGRKVRFTASPGTLLKVACDASSPLYQGFSIEWAPDAAKDPEGKARLAVQAR